MRFTGSAFKQIRFTGILLLLAIVMIAGLVYWQSVEQRRQYLTSRDFRLLSVLAMQVQNLFDGHARIFQAAVDDVYYPSVTAWRDAALNDVPFLRDADFSVSDQPFRSGSRLAPPKLALDADANRFRLRVDLVTTGDGQSNDKSQAFLTVRTPLATLLGPTFLSKLQQGVFDTLALATPDGRVVFATGRRQQELQSTPLDALIPTSLADSKQFPQMARTISVQDAVVASVPYKVFLQPCCGSVAFSSSSDQARGGLLIAGLIEADALHSAALAISPTLVITGILATILAFVIWPFLRLAFIGERQRVTVWDVVQLAACSILGLAVAAIVIITADVYTRLNGDIDEQLEGLAKNLDTHLHEEIRLAYDRLSALERHFYERANGGEPPPQVIKCLHSNGTDTCPEPTAGAAIRAREYDTFALIDANGRQQVKSTPTSFVPSRIRVQGRAYVDAIARGRYWRSLPECAGPAQSDGPAGCFLESVWSWTDGQPQTVLSKPIGTKSIEAATATTGFDAAPDQRPAIPASYRVAALSFTLQTLNEPVLPPGFEFAVIDGRGNVLFHSDRQRNILEDLFIETDQDRRLRGLVAGHSSGAVSIQYRGRPFRAHVEPARIADWSVITLSEQGSIRGLVLEWTAVSLLMLSLYLLVWVLCVVLALRVGASWMWPDFRRRRSYAALAGAYAVLFILFAAVASTGDTPRLQRTAVAIAVAAWALAYVLLRQRPEVPASTDPQPETTVAREYAMAGALFLTLCGIVPGVAFVVRSYDMHVESYIKHRQLGLARSLQDRTEPSAEDVTCSSTADFDRNCQFFYQTTVSSIDSHSDRILSEKISKSSRDEATHHELLLELLEEYLPYYAESSVFMRELMHDHAADDSWRSNRTPGGCLELRLKQGPANAVLVKSALPDAAPRWPWQKRQWHDARVCDEPVATAQDQTPSQRQAPTEEENHDEPVLVMPYLAPLLLMCLIGVAYVMVQFLLRHVYLVGVSEPLWAAGGLVETAGANVLIRYDDSSKLASRLRDMSVLTLGPIARSNDSSAAWRQALMKLSRDDVGHALVITDLDANLDDVDLTRTKLELLEELVNDPTRTVVVLLKTPPATFQDSIRRGRDATLMEMWSRLFKALVLVDWRGGAKRTQELKPAPEADQQIPEPTIPVVDSSRPWNWREWRGRHKPLDEQTLLGQILDLEGRYDRFIRSICEDIRQSDAFQSGTLTAEQILDEIDDRSATYYQRIWASCSDDEKVVLGHVALHGLTTAASRRMVRRLLARRLLTKDPDLRLMNRTFKNFMLSPDIQRQVVALEGSAEASTWDRMRVPFALSVMIAAVFLFTTQREMFNQTVAAVTALAGLVPTVLRTVALIAQRDPAAGPPHASRYACVVGNSRTGFTARRQSWRQRLPRRRSSP